ncbi:MAG: YfiR/HmsC family protein [bacterium]
MKKILIFFVFTFICFIIPSLCIKSQNLKRHEAISAYIYNFAKNVRWQNEDLIKEFRFLIIGEDENIIKELNSLSANKKLRDKPIRILSSNILGNVNNIQLIFVTNQHVNLMTEIYDNIEGKNVLLVSDGFTDKRIIMINFYNSDKGSLLFEINKANIMNQHIIVMQDMILLGGTEIDVANLFREGQHSLRSLQKNTENLENNIRELEKITNEKTRDIQNQKYNLEKQNNKIKEQEQLLNKQSFELNERNKALASQIQKIKEQQIIFEKQAGQLKDQKEALIKGNEVLKLQSINIKNQKKEILTQSDILQKQGEKLHWQEQLVYLLVLIILLVIGLFISIYKSYKVKKKLNKELEDRVLLRTCELSNSNEQLLFELTERKKAEDELNKYRQHLEDMVNERTKELAIAKDKAESADRLKSAFLATMSHELRTPLNSIIGFTGILMKGIAGPINNEQLKQLGMAKGSAHHLLDLINDVLDISKIEAGELVVSLKPFDFSKSIQKVVSSVQPLAIKKNLEIILDISDDVTEAISDGRRVEQIFLNLLNNSIKFTDSGFVKIICRNENGKIITKVIDSGIGIKDADRDKLFKPFSQIDTGLTRNHEGTGLGLSICSRLVEKLGGNISVESEIGVGSTFTVALPIHNNL